MDSQKLAALLKESQLPDTQRLKAITAELQKNYYSKPESLLSLIEIVCTNQDDGVRQQAAGQAARLVQKHWRSLSKPQKSGVRQHLVETTMKEQTAKCRHADSRIVARIASLDLDDGEWSDLIPSLFSLCASQNVAHREVGTYIIFSILEENPTPFGDHLHKLWELCSHTIKDPQSQDVQINTMMIIAAGLVLVDSDEDEPSVQAIQNLIPNMVNVLKAAVDSQDEEKTKQSFEVFQQFLAYDSALISLHLRELLELMAGLAGNKEADDDTRDQALAFLAQTVRYRRMKVQAMKDIGPMLTLKSIEILAEIDEDEDDDDLSPARTALALLDQLSSDLPPKQVIVPLLDVLPKLAASAEPGLRKSGILALGTVAEGAPDFVSTQLTSFMPIVLQLLNDPDSGVRYTAIIGLTKIADEMTEELKSDRKAIVSALLKNLQAAASGTPDKKNIEILRSGCSCIDSVAGGFDTEAMSEFGQQLIEPVGELLNHPDYKVKTAAAGAYGSIGGAMGEGFKPYFEKGMAALAPFVGIKDSEDELVLRSGVCDALGRIAAAVGPETFQPYVVELMRASEEALNLGHAQLRETSFILWSALSKVYKKDFVTFIPGVMKGLFDSLELEEEEFTMELTEEEKAIVDGSTEIVTGGKKLKLKVANDESDEMDDDDEDEDDDDDEWGDYGVSPQALEKEIAIEVLGDVLTYSCGATETAEYLEKSLETVKPLAEHSYEGVRKASIGTLWRLYARVWQLMEEETKTKWEPGFPPKQPTTPLLAKLGTDLVQLTLPIWAEESDREVTTEINRNIAAVISTTGPAILTQEKMLEQTLSVLGLIITRSHLCQQDLGDEDEDNDVEGTSEFDWIVIDSALDVVISLAKAMGPAFGELWKIFEKPVIKFVSSTDDNEKATAVGVIAECIKYMQAGVTPYTSSLLKLMMKRLTDPDPETKSNAAYALGQLIYNSTDSKTYLPSYNDIMQKLEPLLQINHSRLKDNAVGCISRMIIAHQDRVPLADVLPPLINLLPLTEDYEENKAVYECIFFLYSQKNPVIQSMTPKIVPILAKVLAPPEEQLDDETREKVQKMLQVLKA